MNGQKYYFAFTGLCLALLAGIAVSYLVRGHTHRRNAVRPATGAIRETGHAVDWREFVAAVKRIKPGKKVLAEDSLKSLLPPGVTAGQFTQHLAYPHPWLIPDRRMNPAEADYILANDTFDLRVIMYGPSPIFTVDAVFQVGGPPPPFLLKRSAPIEQQLAPEMTDAALRNELRKMAKIKWKETFSGGPHTQPFFYIDLYEATNEIYARFLNDMAMPYDEAFVYYSIKDPTSRIVYYQGRYRVYRGSERLPVFNVSWCGALAFCEQYGKRLIKVEEWLMASGYEDDLRVYPWGNETDFNRRANFQGPQDGYPFWAPVDAFPEGVSPYGLYNMAGNIAEWIEREFVAGGAFELRPETGKNQEKDMNFALARNLHDGFRCVSDEAPR
jgi:hypothetical protein